MERWKEMSRAEPAKQHIASVRITLPITGPIGQRGKTMSLEHHDYIESDEAEYGESASVHRAVMPVVGELWSCRGFEFRVDDVQNGEVYFVRWSGDQERGVPMRCDVELWRSEMTDAIKIRSV